MDLSEMIASTASAKAQMDFQREMSNTAHRREVEDLKAAGLNPVLSAHGQGASTPDGASGDYSAVLGMLAQSMATNAKAVNSLGKSTASAIQALISEKLGPAVQNAKEQYDHDQQVRDKEKQQEHQAFLNWKLFGTPFGLWMNSIAHNKGYDSGEEMLEDIFYDMEVSLQGRHGKQALRNAIDRINNSAKALSKNSKGFMKYKPHHGTF